MPDEPSAQLLERYEDGDEQAAEEIFRRYVERLTRFARSRLSPKLSRRVEPDDIVLSAYRSFFVGVRDGRFSLQRSGDLWRLLVTITMRKVYRQVSQHTAEKRNVDLELSLDDLSTMHLSREPTPDEVVALADELETLMSLLSPRQRRIIELRLQGFHLSEIATELDCSERTVRRMLTLIRTQLKQQLESDQDE